MAIFFVTGLPRAGKTLFALSRVKEIAAKDKRPVYTCNIPEVAIEGWQTIEHPDQWMMVPNGSIILVDELQDYWQLAPTGQKVPGPILELSKHGKRGIDFWFITQEPNLVHKTPRSLCQHHFYVVRAFGTHGGVVHKFERMQDHPEKMKRQSEKLPWRYPKEAFGRVDKETGVVIVKPWYKSADMHNVKRQIPWKFWMIPGAAVLGVLAVWFGLKLFQGTLDKAKAGKDAAMALAPAGGASGAQRGYAGARRDREPMTREDYVRSYQPRIDGMPQTASRYDSVTQPVVAPYPAACIRMGERCGCYSQQGTVLQVPADLCGEIVRKGFFMDWQLPAPPQPQPVAVQAGQPGVAAGPAPALVIGAAPARPVQVAQADPSPPPVRVAQKPLNARH